MKLWLLRHARVQVAAGLCYGNSELEADQAATASAAQGFALLPAQRSALWTSPSARTRSLAGAIHRLRPDLDVPLVDARLREMDFGVWEMQPWENIPREAIDAWVADFPNHRFGGKESAQEVVDRVSAALADAAKQDADEMVWITHAGVIRAVQFLQASAMRPRITSAREWPASSVTMGEWIRIDL